MSTSNTLTKTDLANILNEIVAIDGTDMTAQEIEDFVDSLNITSINAVDYIVEQGVSGAWIYRKWDSGLCEQWYAANPGNYTINTARGSWYSGTDITLTYPIEFTTYPSVTGGVYLASDAYIVQLQIKGYGYTTCGFRIVSSGSIAQNSGYVVMVHAVGKWK